MSDTEQVLEAEIEFFNALLTANTNALEELLTDDFVLVDVLTGSVIPKDLLVAAVGAHQLIFEEVERHIEETFVRIYGTAAIVVGRTTMHGSYETVPFSTHSRYTHVYTNTHGTWQLASAQGTPIHNQP